MSTSNELCDLESSPKLTMKPAVRRIFCCSVTAAAGFIAAYALVAYAIALIYEIVWVVESQSGLPVASCFLMLCYAVVISVTVTLVHGLISKNNKYLFAWLVAVILVLIPECALVFYMSICHWGLQGVYGGAELACYVARLPAVVLGVVVVQSAYAMREARIAQLKSGRGAPPPSSEFDASHYVADSAPAFTNEGYLHDNGKSGSMPDLRRHMSSRQSINHGYPPPFPPPPAYWQHMAERQYAATLRHYPKYMHAQPYGTWVGPRSTPHDNIYKRRHSVVGAFDDYNTAKEYDFYPEDRTDCKSDVGYYRYGYDPRMADPRMMYPPDYDPRFAFDYKREEDTGYGVNLLRHDPYRFSGNRDRYYYSNGLRNSHNSVGNESDDLGKYKDVAL